jgi:predicted nuclease of restriction endonuclease-like (RecB) superfamily
MILKNYKVIIKELKSIILASRYKAAALANKELLNLYFSVGKLISDKTRDGKWGAGVLTKLSRDLQKELPGIRGFGPSNLKRMRVFYQVWDADFEFRPTLSDEIQKSKVKTKKSTKSLIRPTLSGELRTAFLSLSFSHHSEILAKTKSREERCFYMLRSAQEFWSLTILEHKIKGRLFRRQGKLANNFSKAITNDTLREKALQSFKDEYLLDFINLEDPDNTDEKEFENQIIRNIRKFILSIGTDFAFISNQYRLVIEKEEYFLDLLFFNRKLQSLVVFELKRGKFKPEYFGKMNFYLSALDEMVKQPHENPSIGIILCKDKTDKVVEYSFRDFNKAMGVATYKTSKALPQKYKGILPDENVLKKLLK